MYILNHFLFLYPASYFYFYIQVIGSWFYNLVFKGNNIQWLPDWIGGIINRSHDGCNDLGLSHLIWGEWWTHKRTDVSGRNMGSCCCCEKFECTWGYIGKLSNRRHGRCRLTTHCLSPIHPSVPDLWQWAEFLQAFLLYSKYRLSFLSRGWKRFSWHFQLSMGVSTVSCDVRESRRFTNPTMEPECKIPETSQFWPGPPWRWLAAVPTWTPCAVTPFDHVLFPGLDSTGLMPSPPTQSHTQRASCFSSKLCPSAGLSCWPLAFALLVSN